MACFSKDCHWVKGHGDCFYDGVPPSNSPSACEECRFFKAPTNGDRIRSMSDEELAEYICKTQYQEGDVCPPTNECAVDKSCEKCWLEWLKEETK